MLCPPEDILGFSPIQENKRSVQLMKIKECCTVESQEGIAKGIYSMWISTKVIAKEAKAGQFISLFSKDGSRLLPRPISLCEIDREGGRLRIVYRVAGAGTEEFSHLKAGDEVSVFRRCCRRRRILERTRSSAVVTAMSCS